MKVSIFTTCLNDSFFPGAAAATVRLLRKLGCNVDFPQEQTCCGQAQFNNGFHNEARRLAKHFIEVFEKSECVVSPSPSCTAMIRDYYEFLFEKDPASRNRAKAIAAKTYEFTEFITTVLRSDLKQFKPRLNAKVTYHYSCHSRGIDLLPQVSIELIKQIEGVEFIELEKMDQCCGFGGTFAVKMPEVSEALVADKARCIAATGAQMVVVNDGGCTLNIAGYCHRNNIKVEFIHIAQLLARSMKIDSNHEVSE